MRVSGVAFLPLPAAVQADLNLLLITDRPVVRQGPDETPFGVLEIKFFLDKAIIINI